MWKPFLPTAALSFWLGLAAWLPNVSLQIMADSDIQGRKSNSNSSSNIESEDIRLDVHIDWN